MDETVEISLDELRCLVEGCRNDTAGPRDRPPFCAECAGQLEHQEREDRTAEVE